MKNIQPSKPKSALYFVTQKYELFYGGSRNSVTAITISDDQSNLGTDYKCPLFSLFQQYKSGEDY